MKYVQRRANRFEFRFQLPDDVAGKPYPQPWPESLAWCVNPRTGRFKTELVRSLKTTDTRAAERAALPAIEEAHRLVDIARQALARGPSSEISSDVVAALAQQHANELLARDVEIRSRGSGLNLNRGVLAPDGLGMSDDDLQVYSLAIETLRKATRAEAVKMRGGEALQLAVNAALEARGIVLHPNDPAWRQLELAFVQKQRQALDGISARLNGETIETPNTRETAFQTETLSQAFADWANGGGRALKKPRERSAAEAGRAVQRFVELHGDLDILHITKAHARQFRDALAKVPKRLPHKLLNLRLPELLKQNFDSYEARNAQTVNKSVNLLAAVLTKSERDGKFEHLSSWSNPFHVAFDIAATEREHYEPFTIDELNALFHSPIFVNKLRPVGGRGEAAYWLPLIALFAGARRTEIAQLKIGDIRSSEDIWYIDFNDEGEDQNLKNVTSARSVPIHEALITAGLIDYLNRRKKTASASHSLWPGFAPPIADKARSWSKWFGRYLGVYVVDHPSKTFHSFRHTFKRACREAGISEEIHHAFTGHAGGGVGRSYGRARRTDGSMDRGVSLARLKKEIDLVSFPGLTLPAIPTRGDERSSDN